MNRNLGLLFLLLSSCLVACTSAGTEKSGNAPQASNANSEAQANTNSQASKPAGAPADVLSVNASRVEVGAGKSVQAEVRVTIKEGYHINANPASQYQIATQLTLEQAEGITSGQPKYPAPLTKKFSFSDQALAVYEKEAVISVPLAATQGAAKGERTLAARLRYQACDDAVCYPPQNMQISIPVTVK
ncbi:MAG: protein-disulfide reductase DsbD N-terminal domain-containing protein [Acidobacteria bacterium]|nr:protein-disulfide reductase DsbD N-terminal domain-containing protein [Acidobacteriota bacterium]